MKKRHVAFGLIIATLVLGIFAAGVIVVYAVMRPEKIVWDFHKYGRTPAALGHGLAGGAWQRDGRFDLTIIDTDGSVIFHDDTVRGISALETDGRLSFFIHFGFERNAEESYQVAKPLMSAIHSSPEDMAALEFWHDCLRKQYDVTTFQALPQAHEYSWYMIYPEFSTRSQDVRIHPFTSNFEVNLNARCGTTLSL